MKALFIAGGTILGLLLGLWPQGLSAPKPTWWRALAVVANLVLVLLVFGVPTGGDFNAARLVSMNRGDNAEMSIMGTVVKAPPNEQSTLELRDAYGEEEDIVLEGDIFAGEEHGFVPGDRVILKARYDKRESAFFARQILSVNPIVTIPLNAQLEDQARNLYFHVPAAWVATLAWFVAAWFGLQYLRKRTPESDIIASRTAAAGLLFCVLATVTGSFWARLQWGEFWSFDPRQVSIFATLVIFGAYFALRSALGEEELRRRVSSVYLLLLALPIVYFVFVYPRTEAGLHPGSMGSGSTGPVLSTDTDSLNPVKQLIFGLSMFSISLMFFWIVNVTVRTALARLRMDRVRIRSEEQDRFARGPRLQALDDSNGTTQ